MGQPYKGHPTYELLTRQHHKYLGLIHYHVKLFSVSSILWVIRWQFKSCSLCVYEWEKQMNKKNGVEKYKKMDLT